MQVVPIIKSNLNIYLQNSSQWLPPTFWSGGNCEVLVKAWTIELEADFWLPPYFPGVHPWALIT
jgi:hypothetical protein